MNFINIVWNPSDTLFDLGFFQVRYYSLMFVLAFTIGWYLMKKIFINEKKSLDKLDSLFIYTVIATLVGARLGHVFFYDWDYFSQHPAEILLPFRFNPFEFTGFAGLASHGAAIVIILAMYLYIKKFPEFSLLWILDRIVVPISIGAVFVRFGNFMNSEIYGKVVGSNFPLGVKFIQGEDVGKRELLQLTQQNDLTKAYDLLANDPRFSEILQQIPFRHPAQLYEAFGYIFVFIILWYAYWKTTKKEQPGFLFGLFLVLLWTVRFIVEFVKESQGGFEKSLDLLSTGQWLSIPFILIGFFFMFRKPKMA